LLVVTAALVACSRRAPPEPTSHSVDSGSAATSASLRRSPEAIQDDVASRSKRLYAAFEECGRHLMPKLAGHWTNTGSPVKDVWICEGRVRWKPQWGGMSEICFSKVNAVAGGFETEGVWHEDLNDPGDASGVHVYVRELGERVSLELASWEAPNKRTQL